MVQVAILPLSFKERSPSNSRRYDDKHAGYPKKRTIPVAGQLNFSAGDDEAYVFPFFGISLNLREFSAHPYSSIPAGWVELINPSEGQIFFYNPTHKIITDEYIRFPHILTRVQACHDQITEAIQTHGDSVSRLLEMDVYIELTDGHSSSQESCNYYLVDHSRQIICFLREVDTSIIGLPDVRSNIHLARVLRGEYWTHCEYMPRPDLDMGASAKKLQGQLAALMIDNISSEGSTSPFTPEECKNYLNGLENAKEPQFLNWSVARINSLLIQSQIVNLYGEDCARLDRTIVVTGQHASNRASTYLTYSKAMFNGPTVHLDKLEHIWVERIIYTHHWRKLVTDLIEEWTGALAAAGVVWVSDAILLSTASSLMVILLLGLSTASVIFGAVKALFLIRSHRAMGKYAAHGCQFLQSKEQYGTGLQNLSIEYSYPWACVLWSGCLTSLAVLWIMFTNLISGLMGIISIFGYAPTYVSMTVVMGAAAWAYGKGYDIRSMGSLSRISSYRIRTL
ncbi:hypothetical protein FRC12_005088 [Ceratobasidium sp. 428]|nr:hypothetical protein FRC12_005088 [Ceratobasidium sp. 428]